MLFSTFRKLWNMLQSPGLETPYSPPIPIHEALTHVKGCKCTICSVPLTPRTYCECTHTDSFHPSINGSSQRTGCGKVGCDCKKWRPKK